jgi:hypothetical protein
MEVEWMSVERTITFQSLAPIDPPPAVEVVAVSEIFRRDSLLGSYVSTDVVPSFEETNRILLEGRGDDGHFIHVWQPTRLTEQEYQELREILLTKR